MKANVHVPTTFLVFEVGGQRYGVAAADVREVLPAVTLASVPGSGPSICGMMNLRGQVVPVFDLRGLFGLSGKTLEPTDHFVVCQVEGRLVAVWADRAVDLVSLLPEQIEAAEGLLSRPAPLDGVAKVAEGLILLVDPGKLLLGQPAAVLEDRFAASDPLEAVS